MGKTFSKIIICVLLGLSLSGCGPRPPVPPVLGPGIGPWLGWIVGGLAIVGGWLIFKRPTSPSQPNNEYLINALNDINERLRVLEEKIDKMEKNNK